MIIDDITAAIKGVVAIQDLFINTFRGDPHAVSMSHHWCEIADNDDVF